MSQKIRSFLQLFECWKCQIWFIAHLRTSLLSLLFIFEIHFCFWEMILVFQLLKSQSWITQLLIYAKMLLVWIFWPTHLFQSLCDRKDDLPFHLVRKLQSWFIKELPFLFFLPLLKSYKLIDDDSKLVEWNFDCINHIWHISLLSREIMLGFMICLSLHPSCLAL